MYRHYVEKEFYCVVKVEGDEVSYATVRGHSPSSFYEQAWGQLLKGAQVMPLSNLRALEGTKWVRVGNARDRWV